MYRKENGIIYQTDLSQSDIKVKKKFTNTNMQYTYFKFFQYQKLIFLLAEYLYQIYISKQKRDISCVMKKGQVVEKVLCVKPF